MKSPKGINEMSIESLPFKSFPANARKSAKTKPIKIAISIGYLKITNYKYKKEKYSTLINDLVYLKV